MKTLEKQERILVKPWEAAIDRRAFSVSSMVLAPNGTYMIEAQKGNIYDPDTNKPVLERDLAKTIADYITQNNLQDAAMEVAAAEIMKITEDVPKDKRHLLAESEIVFSRTSKQILQEIEERKTILVKQPAFA